MLNPIISKQKSFLFYILLWSMIIILHSIFIYHNTPEISWSIALLDGAVFNIVFAIMAIGVWYAVAYNDFESRSFISIVSIHLVIGLVFVVAWFWLSFSLQKLLVPADEVYLSFLKSNSLWRLLIGFFYYVILVLIFYSIINYRSLQLRKANEAELQNLINEAELSNLKAQLNPHFIFNSLNSISALAISQPKKAREMIIKLSEFLRYSLRQENKAQLVTLQEEMANIDKYLAIEKIRFAERLQINMDINVNTEDFRIPIFILQPIFENAIKHGVYESIEPVVVQVKMSQDKDWLLIKINNNYDPEVTQKKGAGIGLKNIKNRLKLIYGNPDLLTIKKDNYIFKVELVIPQN